MRTLYDVRGHEPGAFLKAAKGCWESWDSGASVSNGLLMTAWQLASLPLYLRTKLSPSSVVAVPDFLNYARLLNTGQAKAMLGLPGAVSRSLGAGVRVSPTLFRHPLRAARQDFWLIAEVLLRYDLALLPRDCTLPLLLHPYLADFAFVFEKRAFVSCFFDLAGRRGPRGVQTQQLPMALGCLARWDLAPEVCAFLMSPGDRDGLTSLSRAQQSPRFQECQFLASVESLPADLQAMPVSSDLPVTINGTIRSLEKAPLQT
jgi:hypothetical protein